jgi:hypothetical protein
MKKILISVRPKWCEKICHEIGRENGKPIYEKPIEVRKSKPSEVPFKAYIYCTKAKSQWRYSDYEGAYENSEGEIVYAQQRIIGEFVCDKVYEYTYDYCDGVDIDDDMILETAINREDINIYAKGKTLYGWHISNLKIYDKPKELSEFKKPCPTKEKGDCLACDCLADNDYGGICTNFVTRPPQSWQYVEEL